MGVRLAIAMAVYNDARYLRRTLESLCAQTFSDFHLTFLDDGSTDDSVAVAEAFAARLPMRILRAPHRGRQAAKRAVVDATDGATPYLFVLDSDVVLPPDALARMVEAVEADPGLGVVSIAARSAEDRPWGQAQAFIDDLSHHSQTSATGESRVIVGGCALFRRQALVGVPVRDDLLEDSDLAVKLRRRWRMQTPRDLAAVHLGVPTTLWGICKRFRREGVRVAAQLRVYPEERSLGNMARLIPLPLALATTAGALTLQPQLFVGGTLLMTGYLAAFLVASRTVAAPLGTRLAAGFAFTVGNVGFGLGYLQEWARGHRQTLVEPARA